jgi:FkbM family methyltransferase
MAARRIRRARRGVPHLLATVSQPASWRVERELWRLEEAPAFQPGETPLLGAPLRYTHPASVVVQYRSIFGHGEYRFASARPDPRILDCGANIGMASLYWKSQYPSARITAFEPDPAIASVLRANLKAHRAADVEVIEAAVWTKDGTLGFRQQGAGGGHIGGGDLGGGDVEVAAVRLRDHLDVPVDFLKLDIEGAETDVILDCADRLGVVANLFVEYHSLTGRPQRLGELVSALSGAGFRLAINTEYALPAPFVAASPDREMDLQLNISAFREPAS